MKLIRTAFLAAASLCTLQAVANTCEAPITGGATDQTVYLEFVDNTTGVPAAGLAFNGSGIDLEYVRTGAAAVDITEATQTANGAHSDGGFVSVGHGRYRLDLPDAAVAAGVREVVVQGILTGYTMLPCVVAISPAVNTVAVGGTAQTARDLGASVLLSSGTGTGQVSLSSGAVIVQNGTGTGQLSCTSGVCNVNVAQVSTDATAADNLEAWLALIAGNGNGSFPPMGITSSGTAQSYSAPDLVLASATAAANGDFNGDTFLVWGSNEGEVQVGCASGFVGATDTVTFEANLTTAPTGTIRYVSFGTVSCSAAGGSLTAQNVWEYATRTLTALDEDSTTLDLDATTVGTVTTATNVTTVNGLADGVVTASAVATGAIDADAIADGAIDNAAIPALEQIGLADAAIVNCTTNTANFAGSTTTVACILTTRADQAITAASGDLEGRELLVLSGDQIYEGRFINDTTWDGANSELQLTLSRALPGTLADAVTAIIR